MYAGSTTGVVDGPPGNVAVTLQAEILSRLDHLAPIRTMKTLRTLAILVIGILPASALAAASAPSCCPGPCCEHGCLWC